MYKFKAIIALVLGAILLVKANATNTETITRLQCYYDDKHYILSGFKQEEFILKIDEILQEWQKKPTLESISLPYNNVTNRGALKIAIFLSDKENLPRLKVLDLSNNKIGPDGVLALCPLMTARPELMYLAVYGADQINTANCDLGNGKPNPYYEHRRQGFTANTKLIFLDPCEQKIQGYEKSKYISEAQAEAHRKYAGLANKMSIFSLRCLDYNKVRDEGGFKNYSLKNVKMIVCPPQEVKLSVEEIRSLSISQALVNLRYLDLTGQGIKDFMVKDLAENNTLRRLIEINLSNNEITHSSIYYILASNFLGSKVDTLYSVGPRKKRNKTKRFVEIESHIQNQESRAYSFLGQNLADDTTKNSYIRCVPHLDNTGEMTKISREHEGCFASIITLRAKNTKISQEKDHKIGKAEFFKITYYPKGEFTSPTIIENGIKVLKIIT